jgi:pilus assembly protein Flp/PilA
MNAPIADFACNLHFTKTYPLFAELTESLKMRKMLQDFFADETGATAIEYGLIAAGISLAIIAVVNGLGAKLNTKFTSINASLK